MRQPMQSTEKTVCCLYIILMDEVQAMHSSWWRLKTMQHMLCSNTRKSWEHDTSSCFGVRQQKYNKSVEDCLRSIKRAIVLSLSQVFRRSQDPKNFQTSLKDIPFAPLPMLPPEMLSGGNKKDCIRVRNLPVDCSIEQILEFLGVHSQHIVGFRSNAERNMSVVVYRSHKVCIWSTMLTYVCQWSL